MRYHYKKLAILSALVILVILNTSWNRYGGDDRNLKVLPKTISSDSLERVMDEFTTALNVNCAFCHAPEDPKEPKSLDYASDANPMKDITRTMMRMTNDMNHKYMKSLPNKNVQLVTCNTCHRGNTVPEIK
jgi:hypothetical protein